MKGSGRKTDDEVLNRISKNIKTIRICLNYTQQQVADRVGISRVQMSRYERKIKIPNVITLNKIAKVLNITLDNLVNHDLMVATKNGVYFDVRSK